MADTARIVIIDDHAILGAVPGIEGFLLACGFSGHGFSTVPRPAG
jgi:glycine/D-amino acid oxidase-like deaminating enzyme